MTVTVAAAAAAAVVATTVGPTRAAATRVTEIQSADPLAALLVVQQHDTTIDRLVYRRAHLPEQAELDQVSARLAAIGARRRTVDVEREALVVRQGELEAQVGGLERRREDLRRKLATGTVPKELERLSREVDGVQSHIAELEDREIELMEAVEPLDATLVELERDEAGLDERRVQLRAAVAEAQGALDGELATERAARADAVADVAPDLVGEYERLRARLGGVAVAQLVGGHCTGCNLALPTSEVDRIRHEPPGTLVTCEQCGRLLVH